MVAEYPDCPLLAVCWAGIFPEDGNAEEAEKIADLILKISPNHTGAKLASAIELCWSYAQNEPVQEALALTGIRKIIQTAPIREIPDRGLVHFAIGCQD